jgi:hypothetical protein
MTIAARIIGTYSRLARQDFRLVGKRPEIVDVGRLERPLHAAGAAVVRRQRQVPVPAEEFAEGAEIFRRRERRFFRVGPLVDEPIAAEAVLQAGSGHELPDSLGFGARQRVRLEGAFDQRDVREIERQALGAENALNHRQVLAAALHAFFDEIVQPTLEELDVRQDALVQGDGNIV